MQIDPKHTISKTIVSAGSVKPRETQEILGMACLSRGQHVPRAVACLNSAEPIQATRSLLTGGTGLSVVLSGALTNVTFGGLNSRRSSSCPGGWPSETKVSQGWFLGPLLGVPTARPRRVLTWSSLCVCVPVSSSHRDASQTGIAPTLTASSYLSHLFKPHL